MGLFGHEKKKRNLEHKPLSKSEWPGYVVTLEGKKFNEFIAKYPLSVIDFWAPWCGPCKKMSPRLRRLSTIYNGGVAFGRLNTQSNPDIAKQYKIMGIPHFGFFSYGKKIASMTGVKSVGDIRDTIEDLLKQKK